MELVENSESPLSTYDLVSEFVRHKSLPIALPSKHFENDCEFFPIEKKYG